MSTVLDSTWNQEFGSALHDRPIDLAARAHDASHYLLNPVGVLVADSADDVAAAMKLATANGLGITLRSGGTSLSGQAGGDGLLVDVRTNFKDVHVINGGRQVICGPGMTIGQVNAALAPYGRSLGPDPASKIAATIGGVVANNSSGMACGTQWNTYMTIAGLKVILPSGTVVDTSRADIDEFLAATEPSLYQGLSALRDRVRANSDSLSRIAAQYSMKNTMGYALNSFVDHTSVADILTHLMVGSEGTLGFIAEATFNTIPIEPATATALLVFPELTKATDALQALIAADAKTLELMDPASIRAAGANAAPDDPVRAITDPNATALLVEVRATSQDELAEKMPTMEAVIADLDLVTPPTFTSDSKIKEKLWAARNGLYTAVAGARPAGSTALLEDIAVPVPALSETCAELGGLFTQYGYPEGVIFGHAKDGNIHFMINIRTDDQAIINRYSQFTDAMVDLVLGKNGTLKAEHGTGRVMAPFVARQFGDELYDVMKQVKALFDPNGVLAPGIVLNDDPQAHLKHLKPVPQVSDRFDRCVECGYCEPTCPSKYLTVTPRQRIALMRTLADTDRPDHDSIEHDFGYTAVDTCAADSLCMIACPVNIDTGKLMKDQREVRHSALVENLGAVAARHWGGIVSGLRVGLSVAAPLPKPVLGAATRAVRTVLPQDWVPQIGNDLPGPGRARKSNQTVGTSDDTAPVAGVYLEACINSLFGGSQEKGEPIRDVRLAMQRLTTLAGVRLTTPDAAGSLCCGTVWSSKGLSKGHTAMAQKVYASLWDATRGGELPVICDAASCTHGLLGLGDYLEAVDAANYSRIRFIDAVTFTRETLLPKLNVATKIRSIVVHPTCSTVQIGAKDDLIALAGVCAQDVLVPLSWGCCAFAGDRGMLHPELTASATRDEAREVAAAEQSRGRPFDAYVSANRTCELGISRATGRRYRHVLEVLAELANQ